MQFSFDKVALQKCAEAFGMMHPEERLFLNQYELADKTGLDSELWKEFLADKQVTDWVRQELQVFKSAQLRKLLRSADNNERSVGAAQMMNALGKACEIGRAHV